MPFMFNVPDEHFHEVWIALGSPDTETVGNNPVDDACQDQVQPEPERCCERAVEYGGGSWRTADQDWFGKSAMHWLSLIHISEPTRPY